MKLINKSKNKTIADNIIIADLISKRVKGLLGETSPRSLYLKTRWGIHTFGMRFPLDVLILDKNWSVRKIKKGLKPYSLFFWNPKYFRVIEISEGSASLSDAEVGDILALE